MRGRPRLVLDTNVVVSAILWQGSPGRFIELAGDKAVQLFTSRALLDELAATLAKKKLAKSVAATGLTAEQMLSSYRHITTLVTARQLEQQVSRDADDDAVLACVRQRLSVPEWRTPGLNNSRLAQQGAYRGGGVYQ